ncbi:MAG: DUF5666 domain-containing protein [Marinobacter sp.]|uniref:DUF5666 domain-containing protein n=1 Tax=Marinobacter sp. TaxID=50741 RepID=UPI003F9B48B6
MERTSCKHSLVVLATALAFSLLSACGGETTVADGGIRGTGSSVGPVSGFGSVFVNGVEFFTDSILNRKVKSNDGLENESDLQKGMILRIEGEWEKSGTGQAKSMEYDDSLRGTVSGLTANIAERRLEFEIHNQKVFADAQTVLKGKQFADFKTGDFVRISAWRQADDRYRASYIEFNPQSYGDDPVEIEGRVDNRSLTSTRFSMNGLLVDYSNAEFGDGLSADNLSEQGAYFEVEGKLQGDTLLASRVQRDDFRRYQRRGEDMELAGPVSSDFKERTKSFGLNGLTIKVTDETDLDDLTSADLKAGVLVQVEGKFVSPTELLASEIEAREGDAEVEGTIDGVCIRMSNCFTVGGVRVQVVTSRTIITDDESDERLTIDDLKPELVSPKFISVEVSGLQRKDKFNEVYVEALRVERELSDERDSEYEVEGYLNDVKQNDIKVLGDWIRTTPDVFEGDSLYQLDVRRKKGEKIVLEVEYEKVPSGNVDYRATSIKEDD